MKIIDVSPEAGIQALEGTLNAALEILKKDGKEVVGPIAHAGPVTVPEQGDFWTAIITYREPAAGVS